MVSRWIWTSLTIVSMWVAVLFTGIWSPSLEAESRTATRSRCPPPWPCLLCRDRDDRRRCDRLPRRSAHQGLDRR